MAMSEGSLVMVPVQDWQATDPRITSCALVVSQRLDAQGPGARYALSPTVVVRPNLLISFRPMVISARVIESFGRD